MFSRNDYEKDDQVILKYFEELWGGKNYILPFVVSIENLKTHKILYLLQWKLVVSIICSNCKNEDEKVFKEKESIEILKFLHFIGKM